MTEPTRLWTARVAVRVPRGSDQSLPAAATRRLQTTERVDSVEVDSVVGLEPALAATVVDVAVVVIMDEETTGEAVVSALETAPGTERVETMTPVTPGSDEERAQVPPD
jgi:hypothetical protein